MPMSAAPSKHTDVAIAPTPEERLKQFWERYGGVIYFTCGVILLGILAKDGWEYLNVQKELGIQKEFSDCTTPDTYLNFALKHPGHPLAGVAEETVADNAFSSGKYLDALKAYSSAAQDLPEGPFRSHAKLGHAMSLYLTGRASEAEADLKLLMDDPKLLKAIRCEAGYHLAGIAIASGRGGEVHGIAEQVMKIDPSSPFSERTFMLRPPQLAPVAAPGTLTVPTVSLPTSP
jgi:hypothetical protein